MKNENETTGKFTKYAKDFNNNLRATRRSKVNGISVDKNQLTFVQTWDLLGRFFEVNNDEYLKLLKFEWKANA